MSDENNHHGITKDGLVVHKKTIDHHSTNSAYQRFNKKVAVILANNVGTMTCFWIFCIAAMTTLPSVLYAMGIIHTKMFFTSFGFELLATFVFSTFIQLVLLPGLMVGQNLQNEAADARSAKEFEDIEVIVDRLDLNTQVGLKDLKDYIDECFDNIEKTKGTKDG
jgi:hypothetical protein